MAEVEAFCAPRPNEKQAAEIMALPYDIYTREEARAAVQGYPFSFLNIDRPETQFPENYNMYAQEVYERARNTLREQAATGVYVCEEQPVYYFYELMIKSGVLAPFLQGYSQTGVIVCSPVDDYLNQAVRRHENTREEEKQDHIRRANIINAQTGPISLTYRGTEALKTCEKRAEQQPSLYDFVSGDGIHHRVWRVANPTEIEAITGGSYEVLITYTAGGHHHVAPTIEATLEWRAEHPDHKGTEEFNYFLSMSFSKEELWILPYNRVVADLNGESPADLLSALDQAFTIHDNDEVISMPGKKGEIGVYLDSHWCTLRVREKLREEDPVEGPDVSFLQNLVLAPLFGIGDSRASERIRFIGGIRDSEELERLVDQKGDAASLTYSMQMKELPSIAGAGLSMPPKPTWFGPKLRNSLFTRIL